MLNKYTAGCLVIWSVSLFAVAANTLVLYLIFKRRKNLPINMRFILALAIFDIVSSLVAFILTSFSLTQNKVDILESFVACQVIGAYGIACISVSISIVSISTLERYLKVCFNKNINSWVLVAAIPLLFILSFGPPTYLAIIGEFAISSNGNFCVPSNNALGKIAKIEFLVLLFILLPLLSFCYLHIAIICGFRVMPISEPENFNPISDRTQGFWEGKVIPQRNLELCIVVRSSIIIVVYNLFSIPQIVSSIWSLIHPTSVPEDLYYLAAIGSFMILLINPLVVVFLHSTMSKDCITLVFGRFKRRSANHMSSEKYLPSTSIIVNP